MRKNKLQNQKKKKQFKTNLEQETSMITSKFRLHYDFFKIGIIFANILLIFSMPVFADDLFGQAGKMLNDVYSQFVGFSTAAAGVGVGSGVLLKKLSLGKQEKIEIGNRIIKDSLVGYGVLNGLGLILNFISNYTN